MVSIICEKVELSGIKNGWVRTKNMPKTLLGVEKIQLNFCFKQDRKSAHRCDRNPDPKHSAADVMWTAPIWFLDFALPSL